MEEDEVAQHPTTFVERTEAVVCSEDILLQEILNQNPRYPKSHLIALRQAILLVCVVSVGVGGGGVVLLLLFVCVWVGGGGGDCCGWLWLWLL